MASITCASGTYFDTRLQECRNCEYVCGDQYGGRDRLECSEPCPGYGVSTTVAPVNFEEKLMWIVIGCSAALAVILIFAAVFFCFKKKCCFWKPAKPTIVREESDAGLLGKSAFVPV